MNLKWMYSRVTWGILLIAGGILFLLQNMNLLPGGDIFWAAVLGLLGLYFLAGFIANRAAWWTLIPGVILLSLALTAILSMVDVAGRWTGPVFLGGVGLAFWLVYLVNRANWWAIIPGGVMFTLAIVSGLEDAANRSFETGGIFFLGLGVTFVLVAVLPNPVNRHRWAFIPAIILLVMGLLLMLAAGSYINLFWPAALVLAGIYLLYRAFAPRRS